MASKICFGAFAAATSVSLFGCGSSSDDPSTTSTTPAPTETIAQLVVADSDLSVLKEALVAADLVSAFNNTDEDYTVFAPVNSAFPKLQLNGTVNCLLHVPSAVQALKQLLEYHVIAKQAVQAKDLQPHQSVVTMEGEKLNITVDNGTVTVDDAKVTQADVEATDGVVHVIDAVLVPPDLNASACPSKSIAQTAIGNDALNTLVSALTKAELVPMFDQVDLNVVYTVFAPTDDAFTALPAGILDCVLEETNKDKLVELLTYHVADGYTFSNQLKNGQSIDTLDNKAVNVTIDGSTVTVNDATVTIPDVTATNGIVHVIDKVLVPPGWTCTKSPSGIVV